MPRRAPLPAVTLAPEEARQFLVGQHGLTRPHRLTGAAGVRATLVERRCIQLDPLEPLGTNADLVALARVDDIQRGDVYRHLYPGHAFEHFAKERCLLPPSAFPWYRHQAAETPWWRLGDRLKRLPQGILDEVLAEVRERGPATADQLSHRGQVKPLDWDGWKGTSSATTMALEVLWTRCQVVVCGRGKGGRVYDLPERALPGFASEHPGDFARWALLERVEAAGLLSMNAGAHWSMLSQARMSPLPEQLVEEGLLERVQIAGLPRAFLAPRGFRERRFDPVDERMRLLGPLDSLIWDRDLVEHVFQFEYVWEVYKPAEQRRWGWYVCPLLHRGQLVGRLEGAIEKNALKIRNVWKEAGKALDLAALDEALERHAVACGVSKVTRTKRLRAA